MGSHPRRIGPGEDFFYYDPFEHRKVSEHVALSHAASARACPINVLPCWVHNDGDTERTPRDARLDFIPDDDPYLRSTAAIRPVSAFPAGSDDAGLIPASVHRDEAYISEGPAPTPPVTPAAAGGGSGEYLPGLQTFLEQTGVIPAGESFSSAAELRSYVRGRMSRN